MNKLFLSFLILLLLTITCFSQNKDSIDVTNITKVTFLNPGVSYEARIGKLQSLYFEAFINDITTYTLASLGNNAFYIDPAFTIQYRYYYNAAIRASKGRRTDMNNLNYISPVFKVIFSKLEASSIYVVETNRRPIYNTGLVWGMQRNFKKRFSFELELGLGYLFTKGTTINDAGERISKPVSRFTPLGGWKFGLWLNKRK